MAQESPKDGDKGGYRQINKSLNICAFDEYLESQAAGLPQLPDVAQLSPRVLRVLGQNPGKGTNTYVLGTGQSRILIDTSGGEPEYIKLLSSVLAARNISLRYVLLTHWHGDHSGGVPDVLEAYPHLGEHIYKNEPEQGQQDIVEGAVFSVEGATVTAVHAPGHSEDHMCFVLQEEMAMFTGDNVLGHGTSAVEDLGVFMASLQKMAKQDCTVGHPAHGVMIDDLPAKIGKELKQKWHRERQVMNALTRLCEVGAKSHNVADIVTGIYGDSVDSTTRTLALEPFIDEVLRKLAGDGAVGFTMRGGGQRKWYLMPNAMKHQQWRQAEAISKVQVHVHEVLA